jgi:hypothetical protein
MWIIGGYSFAFLVVILFQCWPLSFIWTRWDGEHEGKCVPMSLLWVHAGLNVAGDLWVLFLPLPKLFKLQMNYSWRKKARVVAMFSTGVFVTFTSIMRMRTLSIMSYSRPNFTWDWSDCMLWSGIEANTGIICACMPAVRAFFIQKLPNWLQSTQGTKGRSYGHASAMQPSAPSRAGQPATSTTAGTGSKRDEFVQLTHFQSNGTGSEENLTPVEPTAVPGIHAKHEVRIWGGQRSRKRQSWPIPDQ